MSRDDAFGVLVLDKLAEGQSSDSPADLLLADTDLVGHIHRFQDYSRVILVDTLLDPDRRVGRQGEVVVVDEEVLMSWPETSQGAHQLSPLVAVKLFKRLYPDAYTRITLIACCTDRVTFGGDTLEERIVDKGVRLVRDLLG